MWDLWDFNTGGFERLDLAIDKRIANATLLGLNLRSRIEYDIYVMKVNEISALLRIISSWTLNVPIHLSLKNENVSYQGSSIYTLEDTTGIELLYMAINEWHDTIHYFLNDCLFIYCCKFTLIGIYLFITDIQTLLAIYSNRILLQCVMA